MRARLTSIIIIISVIVEGEMNEKKVDRDKHYTDRNREERAQTGLVSQSVAFIEKKGKESASECNCTNRYFYLYSWYGGVEEGWRLVAVVVVVLLVARLENRKIVR